MEPPLRTISYKRHRFPPDVIRHAVWLYFRFTLSFRDVEELLAQRGIEVSYETVRCWTLKFGRLFAHNLRGSRPKPTGRWHLDEMVVKIVGGLDLTEPKRKGKELILGSPELVPTLPFSHSLVGKNPSRR